MGIGTYHSCSVSSEEENDVGYARTEDALPLCKSQVISCLDMPCGYQTTVFVSDSPTGVITTTVFISDRPNRSESSQKGRIVLDLAF